MQEATKTAAQLLPSRSRMPVSLSMWAEFLDSTRFRRRRSSSTEPVIYARSRFQFLAPKWSTAEMPQQPFVHLSKPFWIDSFTIPDPTGERPYGELPIELWIRFKLVSHREKRNVFPKRKTSQHPTEGADCGHL